MFAHRSIFFFGRRTIDVVHANAQTLISNIFFNIGSLSDVGRRWTRANTVVINIRQYKAETGGSDNVAQGECSRSSSAVSNLPNTSIFYAAVAANSIISDREVNQRPLVAAFTTNKSQRFRSIIMIDWILLFTVSYTHWKYCPYIDSWMSSTSARSILFEERLLCFIPVFIDTSDVLHNVSHLNLSQSLSQCANFLIKLSFVDI